MKISQIEIKNFRQYYNKIIIDLYPNNDKNIIIIGGKNGYGKTNFLISIVWCFYGRQIEKVDNNFKQEIKKEKNYDSFMLQSLNWTAKRENVDTFSVSILVSEIELPELNKLNSAGIASI
jgi:DNA sulfur modification protein DndD